MTSETIIMYTLDEARNIIRRENIRKRCKVMRLIKQKLVGLCVVGLTLIAGEVSAIVFGLMLGLYLIFTKEYWF